MIMLSDVIYKSEGRPTMAIGASYNEEEVIKAIANALETFYSSLIEKIDGLDIVKIMKRKNPYLYRAKAMENASEIVENVLSAFVSSSEETIFGKDRKSTRLNSSHPTTSRMPSSA